MVFTEGLRAIQDTLLIAGAGMLLGGLYGVVVGYLVGKKRFFSRGAMELVSMINYSLPGTIVGIAYLVAFNSPPLVITGTAAIIVAAYVFRYGATGIRTTVAILQQIDPAIEEASHSLVHSSRRSRNSVPYAHNRLALLRQRSVAIPLGQNSEDFQATVDLLNPHTLFSQFPIVGFVCCTQFASSGFLLW